MMLEILESGQALYALAAVCLLGLFSRFTARTLYRRLIKETDNMALTKNRYLREFKQKAENAYRLNQGLSNTRAYLEKQIAAYRFMGISLNGWTNLSGQMTVLCFLLGGAASFLSYWYRCDNYYIVLYAAMGILAGLLTMFADSGMNLAEKRSQLLNVLQDYMENSLFSRLARETAAAMDEGPRAVSRDNGLPDGVRAVGRNGLRGSVTAFRDGTRELSGSRDSMNSRDNAVGDGAGGRGGINDRDNGAVCDGIAGRGNANGRDGMNGRDGISSRDNVVSCDGIAGRGNANGRDNMNSRDGTGGRDGAGDQNPAGPRGSIRSIARVSRADGGRGGDGADSDRPGGRVPRKNGRPGRKSQQEDPLDLVGAEQDESDPDSDYLRRGLEQIAASREKSRSETDWIRELSPDELELVGEILKQYLA